MHTALSARSLAAIFFALSLTACGGSDGDDSTPPPTEEPDPGTNPSPNPDPTNPDPTDPDPTDPDPTDPDPGEPTTQEVKGVIVVPDGAQAADPAAKAKAKKVLLLKATTAADICAGIPTGYAPVADAQISFSTDDGQVSGVTAQTDDCGAFSATVPDNIVYVTADAQGYKQITVPVTTFDSDDDTTPQLSLLPDQPDAGYEISSMQWTNNKLYFTIIDTITNKAVLGVPQSAVSYSVNGGDVSDLKSLSYAASQSGGDASIALALDASSSMGGTIYDQLTWESIKDENGNPLSRMRMSARAAHTFLDGKRAGDEVGIVTFDDGVDWLDEAFMGQMALVTGPTDAPVSYQASYPASGFDTDADNLRLGVEIYNRESAIWRGASAVDALPSSLPDDLRANTYYPWYGTTAAYTAADVGRQKVEAQANARKIVVLMSDGGDNASYPLNPDQLIANFQASGIPLWTVAFGTDDYTAQTLQRIATETGGNYVDSLDETQLQAEFEAMQTGIVFQYIGELSQDSLPSNATLQLNLDYGSVTTSREVTVQ